MTTELANKPLEELQALRDEVEAAIAAKEGALEAELADAFSELHWSFSGRDVRLVADRIRRMELQRLAPAEPVDFDVEALAREIVPDTVSYDPTILYRRGLVEKAIRATLARCQRWPGEDWLDGCAEDIALRHTGVRKEAALEMARRLRAYQTGAAS